MKQVLEILKLEQKNFNIPGMDLLYEKEQNIPGSIKYHIRR